MKQLKRVASSALVAAMVLSMSACRTEETTKKKKTKKTKATTESTEMEPSESPEDPSESSSSDTSETTEESTQAPSGIQIGNLKANVPEENCEIQLLPEEERFHYDMALELNPEDSTIGGHVEVSFYNTSSDEWDQLCLRDYSSLFIDGKTAGYGAQVVTNGALTEITNIQNGNTQQTLTYERDQDVSVVWIKLDQNLKPGEDMTLSYDFVATIPKIDDRYGSYKGVFNVTNFYPILAVYEEDKGFSHAAFYGDGECFYSEVSDYHVTLTTTENMKVLSTGTETSSSVADGKITFTFDAPCVRDFVFCACETFKYFEDDFDGVHVRVVYNSENPYGDHMDECAESSLTAARDSLAAFGQAFGKYPYPELDIVMAPIAAGGMEYPNLIICTTTKFYCSPSHNDVIPYQIMSEVVAHEIGHQWFMGIVGSNSGMEPWLDESFASYTECVFYEYLGVEDELVQLNRKNYDLSEPYFAQELTQEGILPVNRPYYDFNTSNDYVYAAYLYGKIALFQMEEIVGREEFHGILREYVQRNAFTNSTEERFFDVLRECVGQDNEDLNILVQAVFQREV